MLPRLCTACSKYFFCKIIFKRHNRNVHGTHVQPPVDDDPSQSGGMYGGVEESQTKFENADKQVDANSQTDFDDDDRSMVVNDGSGSDSDDSSQHGSDNSSQHSDFS